MASNRSAFTTQSVGRTRPSSYDPNASSTSVSSATGEPAAADLLREQEDERNRIQTENFNLWMRITALEERLADYQSTYTEDFENELLQRRIAVEEMEGRLRQQQDDMLRAVGVIEQLKRNLVEANMEIERLRSLSNQAGEVQVLRQVLAKTEEKLERRVHRIREFEMELRTVNDERAAFRVQLDQANKESQRIEAEANQLRQKLQQFDQQRTQGVMQVEHLQSVGNQREKQVEELAGRMEQLRQEKLRVESKYQAQMKKMEEQMRSQLEKLRQDGEKYRNEYMKVSSERDKLQFERERFVLELEATKQDKARYTAEWERLVDRLNGDAEALRLQNLKLSATCENQAQTLENYKSERESALDNLHRLESEVSEWRKRTSEREVSVKTLEMRSQTAEAEVKRLQERLEADSTRYTHTTNDRLSSLEQNKNALEAQNYELRKSISSLQNQLESFESKCQSYDKLFNEEAEKANEYKDRLKATERELHQRMAHSEKLERELAQLTNSTVSESARVHQYSEQIARLTNERTQLMDTITAERIRWESSQENNANLEAQNQHLANQFMALANEIQSIVGLEQHDLNYRALDTLLKEGKLALQRHFKADADLLTRRWQDQVESTRGEVDRLSSKLHSCHMKLESLQRSTLHAKDDAQSIDRSWLKKYEVLRAELEASQRSLEDALRSEKITSAQLEASLSQARREVDARDQAHNGTMRNLERDNIALQESNRLLNSELKERNRSARHSRKQYLAAVAENADLLNAVKILNAGIVERDMQIESLKGSILRAAQDMQRGGSMVEVKEKLLQQLEQTQFMVNETYKKWSQIDIGLGLNGRSTNNGLDGDGFCWVAKLDEYVGRLEVVCGQWGEHSQQSRDMHRRYSEAWRSAALSFGNGKDRPMWVDGVERKCNHLLSDNLRICVEVQGIVEDVVKELRKERKSTVRRSLANDHVHHRSARDPLDRSRRRENNHDDAFSPEHFRGDMDTNGGADLDDNNGNEGNGDEVLFINRGKRVSAAASRGGVSSRTSASRGGASAVYSHSLTSLSRISDGLKAVENKIKTYPDE